jgi:hypothetical protein
LDVGINIAGTITYYIYRNMMYMLYQTFDLEKFPQEDLTSKQKINLLKRLEDVEEHEARAIASLIIEYAKQHDQIEMKDGCMAKLPYRGKVGDDDVSWSVNRFPIPLRWLLYKFLFRYSKSS